LLLFFKKEVLSCLSVCLAPWHRPHPWPPPEQGREILGLGSAHPDGLSLSAPALAAG
jgi:hypothetical protein